MRPSHRVVVLRSSFFSFSAFHAVRHCSGRGKCGGEAHILHNSSIIAGLRIRSVPRSPFSGGTEIFRPSAATAPRMFLPATSTCARSQARTGGPKMPDVWGMRWSS